MFPTPNPRNGPILSPIHQVTILQVSIYMGVWSSGMILALGDGQENLVGILACERPWVQFPARPEPPFMECPFLLGFVV